MRRLSKRERLQEQVKALDVFTKVEPDTGITQSTTSGALSKAVCQARVTCALFLCLVLVLCGSTCRLLPSPSSLTATLLTACLVLVLVINEVAEYNTLNIKYDYFVDMDLRRFVLGFASRYDCKLNRSCLISRLCARACLRICVFVSGVCVPVSGVCTCACVLCLCLCLRACWFAET